MRQWHIMIVLGLCYTGPLVAQTDYTRTLSSSWGLKRQLKGLRFTDTLTGPQKAKGLTRAVMLTALTDSLRAKELALTTEQQSAIEEFSKAQQVTGLTLADTLTDVQNGKIAQLAAQYQPRINLEYDPTQPQGEAFYSKCREIYAAGAQIAEEARALLTPKQQLASDKNWLLPFMLALNVTDTQVTPLAKLFRDWWQRQQCGTDEKERKEWLRAALQPLLTPEQLKNLTLPAGI